ncbi:MAG: ABC transporter ATP-binding protein [Candidatus Puniceispirillales bacterium]
MSGLVLGQEVNYLNSIISCEDHMLDAIKIAPPNHGAAVTVRHLDKTYYSKHGEKHALRDVSLQIPAGSIFGLLGPNGAGKSTLINILAGTVIKSGGVVDVWGTDLDSNARQVRSNIGVVPQELNIDAFFTPRETLEMQAGMFGVPAHERRSDAILELIGLTDKANAYARTLSGGMRRRLLVGKAMVHRPPILVLDEPTAGVDVMLRQRLWSMIRTLNDQGVTIVLTTHYLEEAEALCEEIAILNHGQVITQARTADLLSGAGTRQMIMTLSVAAADDVEKIRAEWARLNPDIAVPDMTLDGRQLHLRYDPKLVMAGAIIMAVGAAGLTIEDISTRKPDLEDVFLALTQDSQS